MDSHVEYMHTEKKNLLSYYPDMLILSQDDQICWMEAIKCISPTSFKKVLGLLSSSRENDTAAEYKTENEHDKPDTATFTDEDITNEAQEFHLSQPSDDQVPLILESEAHDDSVSNVEIPCTLDVLDQLHTECTSDTESKTCISELQLANESVSQTEEQQKQLKLLPESSDSSEMMPSSPQATQREELYAYYNIMDSSDSQTSGYDQPPHNDLHAIYMNLDTSAVALPTPVPPRTYQNSINKGKLGGYKNLVRFQDQHANDQYDSLPSLDVLTYEPLLSDKSDATSLTIATMENPGLELSLIDLRNRALFIPRSALHDLQEIGHG